MGDPRGDGNIQYLDWSNIKILCYCAIVVQDVTIGGNWVKGKWDFSVLYLTIAYESTIISKLKFIFLKII